MAGLYTELLRSLLPVPAIADETIDEQLIRIGKLTKLQAQLCNEKQFNRKVEINKQVNIMKQQINLLLGKGVI
ncbi:hypothetical protein BOO91_17595 [Vibrio navarrensis]|uniref:hypothetical protein n=1 Tax=Vibrio navarrensis TaxID=29495 RepID=UPI0018673780|nr:hypothetical protein [Vibrio navarrensis]MBE3662748.1 hypothetical protein [Vibrio navarrensis]